MHPVPERIPVPGDGQPPRGPAAAPPRWRRARRRAYHLLALAVLGSVRALPPAAGRRLCEGLGRLALRLRPREAARARANLRLAFPDLPPGRIERLLSGSATALGRNLHGALRVEAEAAAGFPSVRDDGAVAAIEALRAEGRGVLVLTGHLGCWELLGAYLARRLGGLPVVTGTIHNPAVDRIVNGRRRQLGLRPLPRERGAGPLLRALRREGVAAVLLDQNTRVRNLAVPFFGTPAPTSVGFARLALRRRPAVLPVAIGRQGAGHLVVHLPPLRPTEPDDEAGARAFLARCNAALEELIRRNPEEWVWFHHRWGDPPPAPGAGPAATTGARAT